LKYNLKAQSDCVTDTFLKYTHISGWQTGAEAAVPADCTCLALQHLQTFADPTSRVRETTYAAIGRKERTPPRSCSNEVCLCAVKLVLWDVIRAIWSWSGTEVQGQNCKPGMDIFI